MISTGVPDPLEFWGPMLRVWGTTSFWPGAPIARPADETKDGPGPERRYGDSDAAFKLHIYIHLYIHTCIHIYVLRSYGLRRQISTLRHRLRHGCKCGSRYRYRDVHSICIYVCM